MTMEAFQVARNTKKIINSGGVRKQKKYPNREVCVTEGLHYDGVWLFHEIFSFSSTMKWLIEKSPHQRFLKVYSLWFNFDW